MNSNSDWYSASVCAMMYAKLYDIGLGYKGPQLYSAVSSWCHVFNFLPNPFNKHPTAGLLGQGINRIALCFFSVLPYWHISNEDTAVLWQAIDVNNHLYGLVHNCCTSCALPLKAIDLWMRNTTSVGVFGQFEINSKSVWTYLSTFSS